ncbi:hypothetical protein GOODEAATRI_014988 [Goodea atripinnis]|uniref:Uncharacterized protein n=1 Tax=Goodea atripinnis TaxID=208336 RepID=A0ABV0PEE5_9TELE
MQQTSRDEEGTLAYVRTTGSLFLKVPQGWKEIQPRAAYQVRAETMQRVRSVNERLNLVALNQPHSGNMMGHDMADQMCYEQAKAMGLAPNYRAFMSSHKQDLIHVVYPAFRDSLPVTNLRVRGLSMLKHLIKPECFVLNGYFPSGRCDVQELAVHIQRQRRASESQDTHLLL